MQFLLDMTIKHPAKASYDELASTLERVAANLRRNKGPLAIGSHREAQNGGNVCWEISDKGTLENAAARLGKIGGKIGGKSTSDAKIAAARNNGAGGGRPSRHDRTTIQRAVARLKAGESAPELAEELGISTAALYSWRRKLQAAKKR